MEYKCIDCKNVFPVKRRFNYIWGKIITFGTGQFYCDDCWEEEQKEREE